MEEIEMKKYLICVDSDGCVFDSMELKHKECFCPAFVNVWGLQNVSRYAREVWDYVNLYSKTRGINRFPALVLALELLDTRPEVRERGYVCPDLTALKKWINETDKLSAAGLSEYCAQNPDSDPILQNALKWSKEVDENIERIVHGVIALPGVKDAFEAFSSFADIMIVSATPQEAIVREWGAQGLLEYVTVVAGQEMGTKKVCIAKALEDGKYDLNHVLMIGDAPGDYAAAQANGVLYYPIVPGKEVKSWKRIKDEALARFKKIAYEGNYMEALLEEFDCVLLDKPAW